MIWCLLILGFGLLRFHSCFINGSNHIANLNCIPFFHTAKFDNPGFFCIHFKSGFFTFQFSNHFISFHIITIFLIPFQQSHFADGFADCWNFYFYHKICFFFLCIYYSPKLNPFSDKLALCVCKPLLRGGLEGLLYTKCRFNNFCLLLLMYFIITSCRRCRRLSANYSKINSCQVHFKK